MSFARPAKPFQPHSSRSGALVYCLAGGKTGEAMRVANRPPPAPGLSLLREWRSQRRGAPTGFIPDQRLIGWEPPSCTRRVEGDFDAEACGQAAENRDQSGRTPCWDAPDDGAESRNPHGRRTGDLLLVRNISPPLLR